MIEYTVCYVWRNSDREEPLPLSSGHFPVGPDDPDENTIRDAAIEYARKLRKNLPNWRIIVRRTETRIEWDGAERL